MSADLGPILGNVNGSATTQPGHIDEPQRRILLADDCAAARLLTAALIRKMGLDVHTATNGEEALAKAKAVDYDMVILDLDMPVLDGIATARNLRSLMKPSKQRLLIVAMSGFIENFTEADSVGGLFDATIAKPITRQRLLGTILALLRPSNSFTDRFASHYDQYRDVPLLNLNDIEAMQSETAPDVWGHIVTEAIQQLRQVAMQLDHAICSDDDELLRTSRLNMQGISLFNVASQLARRASAFELAARSLPTPVLREQARHLVGCALATVSQLKKLPH